ncbi:MAG: aminoacyl-tRNA hydrolase [Halobacteriovoraceae bacterium]|jgi:ribosome-associated protein|nr:aminoacyl-tRNA hydrolase [Halobacteriovoraceae bacterium]
MKIPEDEFEFTFSRSSGAGGQNVNKVNTKATLKWDIEKTKSINQSVKDRFKNKFNRVIDGENGVKISSQRFRTQARNISDCIDKLHIMLKEVAKPPKRRVPTKPTKNSVKRRIKNKKSHSDTKKGRQKIDY